MQHFLWFLPFLALLSPHLEIFLYVINCFCIHYPMPSFSPRVCKILAYYFHLLLWILWQWCKAGGEIFYSCLTDTVKWWTNKRILDLISVLLNMISFICPWISGGFWTKPHILFYSLLFEFSIFGLVIVFWICRRSWYEGKVSNLGYAFVNFTTSMAASQFCAVYHNYKWDVNVNKKICEITDARIQVYLFTISCFVLV